MKERKYQRLLLKLSGEALMGEASYGISRQVLLKTVGEICALSRMNVEIAIVIGAGNIFRGVSGASEGMEQTTADSMGMLATVINALAIQDALISQGHAGVVMSAIAMRNVCESFDRHRALCYLSEGKIIIFAAGTGNPFFTTDTAAVLRALEINADVILKATRVDGVYDKDPLKHPEAVKFPSLTYSEVLARKLKVMDATAISLARDYNKPIVVFNMNIPGNILKAVQGENIGTLVTEGNI